MSLESINVIAQIAASTAVVVSLILVMLQLRQNTEQLKKSQQADYVAFEGQGAERTHTLMLAIATDETLTEIVARGRKGLSNLTETERQRFGYYLMAAIYHMQFAYLSYRQGASNDDIWRGHAGMLAPLMRSPGVREWWQQRRLLFLPTFRPFLDGLAGDGPLMPPGLPQDHPYATGMSRKDTV